ncbi:MAG: serine protease [Planctomycetota bacterium]|nr:serine protease [Planctomycetota bacterium]
MITRSVARLAHAAVAASILLCAAGSPALAGPADAAAGEYGSLLKRTSTTLVTVKFILKVSGQGMEDEKENETTGLMIEGDGLVLASNTQTGGINELMKQYVRQGYSIQPKDIKILVGDDNEGVDAKVIARDSELDLAWIKIQKAPEKPYEFIDLSKHATPSLGDRLLAVERMGKFFDRAPLVVEGRLGGIVSKPRSLYIPASDLVSTLGLPIFTAGGELVGISILQLPSAEESEEGGRSLVGRAGGGTILPAAEVIAATERAKAAAAAGKPVEGEAVEGEKSEGEKKDAEGEKATEEKPGEMK